MQAHPGITTTTAAVLTKDSILAAIDEAVRQMDADEVPAEGRRLYVNSDLKPILNSALNRQWGSDGTVNTVLAGYNNMPIIYVPKSRFYTGITLADGSTAWGFAKAAPVYTVTASAPARLGHEVQGLLHGQRWCVQQSNWRNHAGMGGGYLL